MSYSAINIQKDTVTQKTMDVEVQPLIQSSNKTHQPKQFLEDYESIVKKCVCISCILVVTLPTLFFIIKYLKAGGFENSDAFPSSESTKIDQIADVFKSIKINTTNQITENIQNKSL